MKKINPTQTASWQKLTKHFEEMQTVHLKDLFVKNTNRLTDFKVTLDDFSLDFSRNKITKKTCDLLVDFAHEMELKKEIEAAFSGEKINTTENRAVLHSALRSSSKTPLLVDGTDIRKEIQQTLEKMQVFSEKVITGAWKGYTGKPITTIVNIGIGGSDLGPAMVTEGLRYYKNHLQSYFVSNIDGDHLAEIQTTLDPETTLFVIVSKTFTTQETLSNANSIKQWFLQSGAQKDIAKHFVAVSTNLTAVTAFGIDPQNIFPMWNWVGGRFSLWSAVGVSICLSVGFPNFKALLEGAETIDEHYKNTEFHKNIPVLLGLLSTWYVNFFGYTTEAVLPYTQYLEKFVSYLQQASMESNGKSVDRNGEKINYQTGTVVWGGVGSNNQHAFMQLLHQGTQTIPADFIGYTRSLHGITDHHKKLMANFYAQPEALTFGKSKEAVHLDLKFSQETSKIANLLPYKVFEGNKPSNLLVFDALTPRSLGKLIAIYEHKIHVQGILWNINSYDQFGVELGKELAKKKC